ncbi:MAG: HAMP domain-containing sensor histidine kinase, partial [Myxococcota bacterium]
NRALAASTEEVRQLSYVASHDLSNPVRTIRTLLPMLQEELQTLPDPAEQWFRYVSDAADSLHRAQQGLWAFSQITHERRFDRCDLLSIVTRARAACEWDEDTSVEVDPLPQVWGNIDQLEVVFMNLFSNAIKYRSRTRPLSISVTARSADDKIVVAVSDNGDGFPASAAEKVFELFTRLDPDRSDGDGLGLAVCRRILIHHGGWIHAAPTERGATFEFALRAPEAGHAA